MRRAVLLPILFILLASTTTNVSNINKAIYISSDSKMFIKGTSNVNKFECHYNVSNINNPIPVKLTQEGQTLYFKNTRLILDSSCFDCGGKAINKDFKSILKANEYPNIILNVIELNMIPNESNKVEVSMDIEIAGIKKPYKMIANLASSSNYEISGKLKLNINHFNLQPPKKMFGLIIVSEIIEINFDMTLNEK
jgi:hypothetical protein